MVSYPHASKLCNIWILPVSILRKCRCMKMCIRDRLDHPGSWLHSYICSDNEKLLPINDVLFIGLPKILAHPPCYSEHRSLNCMREIEKSREMCICAIIYSESVLLWIWSGLRAKEHMIYFICHMPSSSHIIDNASAKCICRRESVNRMNISFHIM